MAIRTSPETAQLDEAFAKAQAKFEAAAKSSENPGYRSKYADISSINGWVPCYVLSRIALSYTKRISELRREGHVIEKHEVRQGLQRQVSYRLVKP